MSGLPLTPQICGLSFAEAEEMRLNVVPTDQKQRGLIDHDLPEARSPHEWIALPS